MTNHRPLGRRAMITGASSGIGRALALELARRGCDVLLVARREQRLSEVAALCQRLGREHGAELRAEYIAADLSDPRAPALLTSEAQRRGFEPDILINNAGYGQGQRFLTSDWAQHAAFLRVMLTSVVELTHRLVPAMVARQYGRVMQVSSLAQDLPATPGDALYGPTKTFLVRFAQGLNAELAGTGVSICALCPGYTYSEFHDVSGTRNKVQRLPAIMWSEAEPVAREGVDALLSGTAVCYPGRFNRVARRVLAVVPNQWVMAAWARRPSRR